MKKITLYHKNEVIGSITLTLGGYAIEAKTENMRLGLEGTIEHGICCRRTINLDEVLERDAEPRMIRIDADPAKPDFFEQLKLYFETSFDTTCTITE